MESNQALRLRADGKLMNIKTEGRDGLKATTGNVEGTYENLDCVECGRTLNYREAEEQRDALNGLRLRPGRNLLRANGIQTEVINQAQPAL